MNISLPAPLRKWVEEQVANGDFGTISEYFRQLLREEQKRTARLRVEEKLREALASGLPVPVTAATWEESEKRVEEQLKAARKQRAHAKNR